MSIQQQVVLRYHSEGHARFALPTELCSPENAERIVGGVRALPGVYRVDLYPGQRKLSIRYIDALCSFPALVRSFNTLLNKFSGTP